MRREATPFDMVAAAALVLYEFQYGEVRRLGLIDEMNDLAKGNMTQVNDDLIQRALKTLEERDSARVR